MTGNKLVFGFDAGQRATSVSLVPKERTAIEQLRIAYDTFGNTKEIKAGTNKLVSYDYNAGNGKLNTLTYGNGLKVKYVYDELDRISEICHNNNNGGYDTAYSYEYDSYGKLFSVTDHISGETTVFSYGANGKLIGSYVFDTSTYNTLNSTGIYYNDDMKVSRVYRNVNYSGGWFMSYYSYNYNTDTGRISSMSVMDEELYGYFTPKYDGFGRLTQRTADFSRSDGPDDTIDMHYEKWTYSYSGGGVYGESSRVSKIVKEIRRSQSSSLLASTEYRLTYDGNGNITEIADSSGVVQNRYCYDDLGQLIREDNREMGRSYTYDYDDAGNRIQKKAFAFTLGALGSAVSVYQYSYASSGWRDRLTYDDYSYDSISYDAIGNPISIENDEDPDICISLRWKGRLLMSFSDSEGPSVSFTYNADGIRTSKTVGGVKHKYTLDGSRIVSEVWTKNGVEYFLYFIYDENGSPAGIEYRTSEYEDGEFDYYFFDKNIFGDIIGIYNENGRKICTYTYNAWGECTVSVASGLTGDDFLMAHEYNPFRYRGYYYDGETGYYYLQTRYYSPDLGRFLNADGYLNANGDILGYNMFAYCSNNPVMGYDPTGEWSKWLSGVVNVVGGATQIAAGVALGATVGWTGFGAVVAGFLIVNGVATTVQGIGQIVNDVSQAEVLREDNVVRTGVQEVGRAIDGDAGAQLAGDAYDLAVVAANIYAGKVILEASMPQIIDSKVFSANNGYGLKIGKSVEILYRNPNAAGGPGGTIFSYKGILGKFRIDWDPSHGFHSHPPGH